MTTQLSALAREISVQIPVVTENGSSNSRFVGGRNQFCYLDEQGYPHCIRGDRDNHVEIHFPEDVGPFKSIQGGNYAEMFCGLGLDDRLTCLGPSSKGIPQDLGEGTQVAVGDFHACVIGKKP
jgi:hypothetical protein